MPDTGRATAWVAEALEDRTLLSNITITDVTAVETDAGTTNFVFTVTRDDNTNLECVTYTTADGTATVADGDYSSTSAILCFVAGGPLSLPVTVAVSGDLTAEANETFLVNLTNPSGGAIIADAQGVGTIVDDDTATVSINDVSAAEGSSGTTDFVFAVTLDNATAGPFSVDFTTAGINAAAGSDFSTVSGTLNFAGNAGEMQFITIQVTGDTTVEADESFAVNLSNATGGVAISDNQGLGTIVNDDTATLTVGSISQNEGDAGTTDFTFTVTLDKAVQGGVDVNFSTASGTAASPSDYTDNNGTLVFTGNAGETQTFTVVVNADVIVETDETFTVALSNVVANGAGVDAADIVPGAPATNTILNDDVAIPPPPAPALTDPTGTTGDTTPTIKWNAVAEANAYQLLVYDVAKGSAVVNQTGLTATEFTTGPLRQATFQAFVRGTNSGGNGDWSAALNFNVLLGKATLTAPAAPAIDATPTITWTPVPGAVTYELLVYHVATGREVVNQTGLVTGDFTTKTLAGGDHQAFVRAVDVNGAGGPYSAPLNFNIFAPPSITSPINTTTDTTPTIQWSAVAGAGTYELLVYNVALGTAVVDETGIATTEFTAGLLRQGNLQAFVRAIDGTTGAAGPYSAPRNFVLRLATSGLSVSVSNGIPTFTWPPIAGADAYELLVYNVDTGQQAFPPAVTINSPLTLTPLNPGTYQAFVRGFDTFGAAGPFGSALNFQVVAATPETAIKAPAADAPALPNDAATAPIDTPPVVDPPAAFVSIEAPTPNAEAIEESTVSTPPELPAFRQPTPELENAPGSIEAEAAFAAIDTAWADYDAWEFDSPDTDQSETTTAAVAGLIALGTHKAIVARRNRRRQRRDA